MNEIIAQKLKLLPDSPGCYQMKENGKIIYVGKAVNLKNRVRSYFHGRDHTPKVAAMVSHITDFDIILCRKAITDQLTNEEVRYFADVNGDGDTGVSDLVMLYSFVSGKNNDMEKAE